MAVPRQMSEVEIKWILNKIKKVTFPDTHTHTQKIKLVNASFSLFGVDANCSFQSSAKFESPIPFGHYVYSKKRMSFFCCLTFKTDETLTRNDADGHHEKNSHLILIKIFHKCLTLFNYHKNLHRKLCLHYLYARQVGEEHCKYFFVNKEKNNLLKLT